MHQFLLEEKIDFYLWVSSEKKKKAGVLGTYMHMHQLIGQFSPKKGRCLVLSARRGAAEGEDAQHSDDVSLFCLLSNRHRR